MDSLPSSINDIFDDVFKLKEVIYHKKAIIFENNGLEVLKEFLPDLSKYYLISPKKVVLFNSQYNFLVTITVKELNNGFEFTATKAHHDVEVLEFLLTSHHINKYQITKVIGGRSYEYGVLHLVEVDKEKFIHDPIEFHQLGYTLKYRL